MSHHILDVGNCQLDHSTLSSFLTSHFDCDVVQAHGTDDAVAQLRSGSFDLVLVNRKLDLDYSDGIEVIRRIKADADLASVPCMLVTNYPEHQDAAMADGALRGFGKLELATRGTVELVRRALEGAAAG